MAKPKTEKAVFRLCLENTLDRLTRACKDPDMWDYAGTRILVECAREDIENVLARFPPNKDL